MDFMKRAREIEDQIVADRRYLHENAELGFDLQKTAEHVKKRLGEMGIAAEEICKGGVTAVIGGKKPGKTILLRADMDALPMCETSGLPFQSKSGIAHTCGHDLHTAMLLGGAKLLKECEEELDGTVKLMFQPAEETFNGAAAMLDAGLLHSPQVDASFGMHVFTDIPFGTVGYCSGPIAASCDGFRVTITGKGCHGAQPHRGIDSINVGVHIHLALQSLIAREAVPTEMAVLTVGQFTAGTTANIIPEEAVLQGTLRTYNRELRAKLAARMREVIQKTADLFGAEAEIEAISDIPPFVNDPDMTKEIIPYIEGLGAGLAFNSDYRMTASDDYAHLAEKVPTVYIMIGAGPEDGSPAYPNHNPNVVFHEGTLPVGAAIHAACAYSWLRDHR